MNETLTNELCTYLGTLKQEYDSSHDWLVKEELGSKINAIELLLDVKRSHIPFGEKIRNIVSIFGK